MLSCCTFAPVLYFYMQLIIDLGNTNTKLAVFRKEEQISLHTVDQLTVEYLNFLFDEYTEIKSCILSHVTHYPDDVDHFLNSRTTFLRLSHQTPLPFALNYETPQTLGKDRIAAVAGAMTHFPETDLLVIDAGTSITFDFVTASGQYLGGGISPGIVMRYKALNTFTGKLPLLQHEPEKEAELIGKSTNACIDSGVKNGVLAEVEGLICRYRGLFPSLKLVLSGGDYKYFEKYIKSDIFATPNIVIQGLKKILDFNENK